MDIDVVIEDAQPINVTLGDATNYYNGGATPEWGNITGTLSDQTDLQTELNNKVNTSSLATVATSGDYGDLTNTPTLGTAAAADTTDFATAAQGSTADTALQPGDDISDLTNDAGYITAGDIPADAVSSVNTQTGAVVLDADDIDDTTTTNKFATAAQLSNADTAVQPGDLATVATTGDYDDLINKPTIASEWGDITGTLSDQTDLQNALDEKADASSLATVATTGDYDDLTNTPSIPNELTDLDTTVTGSQLNSDHSKLSGIEANADVTDATNVAAAGAVMTSGDQTISGDKTFTGIIQVPTLKSHDGNFQKRINLDGNNFSYQTYGSHRFAIYDGAAYADKFHITRNSGSNWGVGIGVSTPTERLDVDGNIAVSGTVDGRDVSTDGATLDALGSSVRKRIGTGTGMVYGNTERDYRILGQAYLNNTNTATPSTNRWYFEFYDVVEPVTVDRVAIEVTAAGAAGKLVRMALYTADTYMQPQTLIQDFGTVATDVGSVPTMQIVTINPTLTLQPGRYVGIIIQDGGASFRTITGYSLSGNSLNGAAGVNPYRNIGSLGGSGTVANGFATVNPRWERDIYTTGGAVSYFMRFREVA